MNSCFPFEWSKVNWILEKTPLKACCLGNEWAETCISFHCAWNPSGLGDSVLSEGCGQILNGLFLLLIGLALAALITAITRFLRCLSKSICCQCYFFLSSDDVKALRWCVACPHPSVWFAVGNTHRREQELGIFVPTFDSTKGCHLCGCTWS